MPLTIVISEHLTHHGPKPFIRILHRVTERCKFFLFFGVKGRLSVSLDMTRGHTYSFHVACRLSDVAKEEDNPQSEMGWGVRENFGGSLLLQQS